MGFISRVEPPVHGQRANFILASPVPKAHIKRMTKTVLNPFSVAVESVPLRQALTDLVRLWPLGHISITNNPEKSDLVIEDLSGRVRLGAVLDWVLMRSQDVRLKYPDKIICTTGVLWVTTGIYARTDTRTDVDMRLSRRECDLILHLFMAPDRRLNRSQILANVWGYVPGLETHTLETHIYRLRQKIEKDPADPQILVTVEGGYGLNIQD